MFIKTNLKSVAMFSGVIIPGQDFLNAQREQVLFCSRVDFSTTRSLQVSSNYPPALESPQGCIFLDDSFLRKSKWGVGSERRQNDELIIQHLSCMYALLGFGKILRLVCLIQKLFDKDAGKQITREPFYMKCFFII